MAAVGGDVAAFPTVGDEADQTVLVGPQRWVMMADIENTRARLVEDFSAVLAEAEDMLKRAATETGDKARDLRDQVEAKLLTAKLRLQELEGQAIDNAKAAARATDDYVHDNPWQAIGVAAAVGFLVGLVISRR